ncbi:hypothetical protein [Burkholderia sp. LMG 21824]|uniref:hypothetical protein n=1 Tax=Burkholderia sp. LMG 21824 TaxID=3158172 RepID=UPI003C2DC0CB
MKRVVVMVDAQDRGETVYAAFNVNCETVLIHARSERADRYWHVDSDQIVPIPAPRCCGRSSSTQCK